MGGGWLLHKAPGLGVRETSKKVKHLGAAQSRSLQFGPRALSVLHGLRLPAYLLSQPGTPAPRKGALGTHYKAPVSP